MYLITNCLIILAHMSMFSIMSESTGKFAAFLEFALANSLS